MQLPVCPKLKTESSRLELKLERELNQARVVHGVVDHSETGGRVYVHFSGACGTCQVVLRMIEEIEKLRPELQIHPLPERQRNVLDQGEVCIYETRTVNRRANTGAEFSGRGESERAWVEPILNCVNLCGTARLSALVPALVGVTHLVRTREVISVVGKIHSRTLTAVDHVQRESRRGPFDQIDLPMPQRGINRTVPIATPMLALAEREVINDAGSKTVVEVEFR